MTSLVQACWAAAVTLALYGFYCFWEAGRADLVSGFRHLAPGRPGAPGGSAHRLRGWMATLAALILGLGALASAL
jgi:hypothetical protein